jgi:hypothetical protein
MLRDRASQTEVSRMIVMFGTRLYGKVDHVPGLFYVASHFAYLNFVPLFPTASYLIFEGSEGEQGFRGVPLKMNGKSVFFGYLRALALLGGVATIVLGGIAFAENDSTAGIVLASIGLVALLVFWVSYRLSRPSPHRALDLASRAGIPPEVVAQYFVGSNLVPANLDERPRDDYSPDNR